MTAKKTKKATKAAARQAPAHVKKQSKTSSTKTQKKQKPKTQYSQEINMTTKAEKMTAATAALGKDQMDALMQSGNVWMKGTEEIVKTYVSLVQGSVEKNTEAVKSLMGCKTLNELTEAQTRLAQESFEDMMSSVTKLSELTVKVATDSFEPINTQFSKTLKKTTESVAA